VNTLLTEVSTKREFCIEHNGPNVFVIRYRNHEANWLGRRPWRYYEAYGMTFIYYNLKDACRKVKQMVDDDDHIKKVISHRQYLNALEKEEK
jgi:hypothetical protein